VELSAIRKFSLTRNYTVELCVVMQSDHTKLKELME